jgi:hypothetical protein
MKAVKTAVVCVSVMAVMAGAGFAQTAAPQTEAPAQVQAPAPAPVVKTWADSVKVKGDLRYRYESIDDDSKLNSDKETYTRQRDRVRARLGAEAVCNSSTKAGIEISTGQADPVSGNQSLGDGFGKKDFKLNLAYIDYKLFSDDPSEASLVFGKMKNPFITMNDDLVWDGDATPEGVALKSQMGNSDVKFMANGGYLWMQERSDKNDSMIFAGQAALNVEFAPEFVLTVGASYYGFESVMGYDVIDWEAKNNAYGNSTQNGTVSGSTTNKAWKYGYEPIVYFASLEVDVGMPVTLYGQSLSNGEVDDHDTGTMYGVSVGKAKNPKTWELGYSYAELEKNGTIGMLTDSDRWGGGTDGKGSKVYGKYQIMKNLQVGVTYFMDEKKISDPAKTTDYERMQIDLVASF